MIPAVLLHWASRVMPKSYMQYLVLIFGNFVSMQHLEFFSLMLVKVFSLGRIGRMQQYLKAFFFFSFTKELDRIEDRLQHKVYP